MIPALALLTQVASLAPAVAKWLGKGEEAAEIAAGVARAVTGAPDNAMALEELRASPDKLLEYKNTLAAMEVSLEKLYVDDKHSARKRDLAFLKHGKRNYRADFLTVVSVLIILLILWVVIKEDTISEFAKGSLTTILGVFLNQLTNIFNFEFGTTRKNEEKQDRITDEYFKS